MARDIHLTRLVKDKWPVGEDCENDHDVEIEVGDAVQIFGDTAYCQDCQEERAEEKGVDIVIHEGSKTRAAKKKKVGKKTARKNAKNKASKMVKLEVEEEEEEEEEVTIAGLDKNEVIQIVNDGMKMLRVKIEKQLAEAFEFLQSPDTGEYPELPTGKDTFIRSIQESIWEDGWLFKQLNTKNGRVEAHSTPDKELELCPASTASGDDCQNKPKAGKVYCGSHKVLEDVEEEKPIKKGKKVTKKEKELTLSID